MIYYQHKNIYGRFHCQDTKISLTYLIPLVTTYTCATLISLIRQLKGYQIQCVPSTIYKLLLLKGCSSLVELPADMSKLIHLRHLDIGGTGET